MNKNEASRAFNIIRKSRQKVDSMYERNAKDFKDLSPASKIPTKKK